MSAALTVGLIGTGASIFSGIQQGKRADAATSAALAAFNANQGVASELKQRQKTLVDTPLAAKIAELTGRTPTAAGQQALDRFNYEMGESDRAIRESAPQAGEGVTTSRELTNQFRRATGIAGINLQDRVAKENELRGYLAMAQQTPGWANVATGANTQIGNFQQGQAAIAQGNEASAYGIAAKGMAGLADMYSRGYRFGFNPDVDTSGVSEVTTNTTFDSPAVSNLPFPGATRQHPSPQYADLVYPTPRYGEINYRG